MGQTFCAPCTMGVNTSSCSKCVAVARMAAMPKWLALSIVPMPEWPGGADGGGRRRLG